VPSFVMMVFMDLPFRGLRDSGDTEPGSENCCAWESEGNPPAAERATAPASTRLLAGSNRFTSTTMGMDMVRTPEVEIQIFCVAVHLCRFGRNFRLLLRALRQH
jgi:hypothetical protein